MLGDGAELALLDVREEGVFSKAHLLFGEPVPLSRLEMRIDATGARGARLASCCCDRRRALAQRAAAVLRRFGYRHLSVLAGGIGAWKAAGFELFSGVNVPSKAFGEFVEHRVRDAAHRAAELKAEAGRRRGYRGSRLPADGRVSRDEHPGRGIDCPGAELVYRVHDIVPRPETLVVVNCAGRTRSIIGAQSLINAGIPNKVVALKNGTMGWHLAGLSLEHGAGRACARARGSGARARHVRPPTRVAERFGVKRSTPQGSNAFAGGRPRGRSICFDVRSPDEYAPGIVRDSCSAPGGQLVQATDVYVAVRNARIVLVDDRRRARDHDRVVAPADGVARGVRAR